MTKGGRVEILAPAGSPEALVAALERGADAVYLGLKQFNARGNAVNFSLEELGHYVPLAHQFGTKVYLTLNTIVKMSEMAPILESLRLASDCGIDGVILQDLGLSRIIARYFPHLRRHASTQLAIHNLEGVRFCVDEGFERVVLARELTLDEIREIRQVYPPDVIELEVFCHGAMCYTYSGMCFFSGSVGGRSGNRGECAYTCRKGYKILNETRFPFEAPKSGYGNFLFSMKDMNTLEMLPQLLAAGVDSLKIEGRRKGPAYVGAAVQAYRQRMDGMATGELERDLKLSFGRAYTKAFYERGQFGDAPIDMTSTGSQGLEIGILDENGQFVLNETGIQCHDGIRLVHPDRTETLLSFTGYRCSGRDRMRPAKGDRITLTAQAPAGTKVMWVRAQSVSQRYRPDGQFLREPSGTVPMRADLHVAYEGGVLKAAFSAAGARIEGEAEVVPSTSGKRIEIRKTLFRFGDVPFWEGRFEGPEVLDGFVPVSQLKKLRRDLLERLVPLAGKRRQEQIQDMVGEACSARRYGQQRSDARQMILRLDRPEQLAILPWAAAESMAIDFLMRPTIATPDWQTVIAQLKDFPGPVRLVLPMVLRKWDLRLIRRRLAALVDHPFEMVLTNPGHVPLTETLAHAGWRRHADFSIYHINSWAVAAVKEKGIDGRLTLSLEDDRGNMEALLEANGPSEFEVIAYTDTPLFIAEACSLAALYGGCPGTKTCGHEVLHIENEHGDQFQVRHDRCRSTVIGDRALSWSGNLKWFADKGVRNFRMDFTVRDYTAEQIKDRASFILNDLPLPQTHSENLDRTLL